MIKYYTLLNQRALWGRIDLFKLSPSKALVLLKLTLILSVSLCYLYNLLKFIDEEATFNLYNIFYITKQNT